MTRIALGSRGLGGLAAVLAAFVGSCPSAMAAEPRPERPYSTVAQSTSATAATGRRPIGQRITSSNLPHRSPAVPQARSDGAARNAVPARVVDAPPALASPPPVADVLTEPGEFVSGIDIAVLADEEPNAPEEVAAAASADRAPAAPLCDESSSDETDAADIGASEVDVDESAADASGIALAEPDDTGTSERSPIAAVAPVVEPRAKETVRDRLLQRIRGAFAARTHASASPVRVPDGPTAFPPPAQPPAAPETPPARARIEFDVRESRSLVGEGEQIVVRIAMKNVGGEPAEGVTTTLFFAEGIEPVQAIGHAAEVYPGEVRFAAVPEIPPGSSVDLLVTAVGTRPGSVTYRGELECRQLAGRIAREGAVTVRSRAAAER